MPAKEELQKLVSILSEYECKHLLSAVQTVAAGNRFWEDDVGVFYNEYVKVHYFNNDDDAHNFIPAQPVSEEEYFVPIPIIKPYVGAPRIELPPSESINHDISETLLQRRSRRDYNNEGITLGQLSTLLQHACGTTGLIPAYDYSQIPLRSFPSSGGLQSPELYLSVHAVGGLSPGLYHYNQLDHVLELLKPGNHGAKLGAVALGQPFVETSAVLFILTGCYERLRWKYGERAYRFMCMDVGFLGENIYLIAEAMGLGVCAIAGFVDNELEELLDINGRNEMVLLLMTMGALQDDGASGRQ